VEGLVQGPLLKQDPSPDLRLTGMAHEHGDDAGCDEPERRPASPVAVVTEDTRGDPPEQSQ
jgi:hypothetical protein